MKKNKYEQKTSFDAEIDLHGMTDYEAEDAVLIFLKNSRNLGHKNIKIITGKGIQSIGEPVLKKLVRQILIQQNLKFSPANAQNGGTGSFVIRLN